MLLHGLGFLKERERENVREKAVKGRQKMLTTIMIDHAIKGSYCLLFHTPLFICSQVQEKEIFLLGNQTRFLSFSVLAHITHHKEVDIRNYSSLTAFSWRTERRDLQPGLEGTFPWPITSLGHSVVVAFREGEFSLMLWVISPGPLNEYRFQTREMGILSSFHSLRCSP